MTIATQTPAQIIITTPHTVKITRRKGDTSTQILLTVNKNQSVTVNGQSV